MAELFNITGSFEVRALAVGDSERMVLRCCLIVRHDHATEGKLVPAGYPATNGSPAYRKRIYKAMREAPQFQNTDCEGACVTR